MGAAEAAKARESWAARGVAAPLWPARNGAVLLPARCPCARRSALAGAPGRSTRAVPTPFCFPTAEPETLSSLSSWFQGPPRDALIGWDGRPRPRQSPREGEGSRGGSPVRAPPRPSRPPRTRTRTAPGSGGVSPRGERARAAALVGGAAAGFHPRPSPAQLFGADPV